MSLRYEIDVYFYINKTYIQDQGNQTEDDIGSSRKIIVQNNSTAIN